MATPNPCMAYVFCWQLPPSPTLISSQEKVSDEILNSQSRQVSHSCPKYNISWEPNDWVPNQFGPVPWPCPQKGHYFFVRVCRPPCNKKDSTKRTCYGVNNKKDDCQSNRNFMSHSLMSTRYRAVAANACVCDVAGLEGKWRRNDWFARLLRNCPTTPNVVWKLSYEFPLHPAMSHTFCCAQFC
jgi:hypothetical protein